MSHLFQKLQPKAYYQKFIENQARPCGRSFEESRPIEKVLNPITTSYGSCMIKKGETLVVCGIKAEIAVPEAQHPNSGFLIPSIELTPLCSPKIKPGPPSERAQVLTEELFLLLRGWAL